MMLLLGQHGFAHVDSVGEVQHFLADLFHTFRILSFDGDEPVRDHCSKQKRHLGTVSSVLAEIVPHLGLPVRRS
jgi:hypothetical protein